MLKYAAVGFLALMSVGPTVAADLEWGTNQIEDVEVIITKSITAIPGMPELTVKPERHGFVASAMLDLSEGNIAIAVAIVEFEDGTYRLLQELTAVVNPKTNWLKHTSVVFVTEKPVKVVKRLSIVTADIRRSRSSRQ